MSVDKSVGRPIFLAEIARDRRMRDLTPADIQAGKQVRVRSQRSLPSFVGDSERMRQRHVVERVGTGARDCAGHVGNAIMDDAVDDVGWIRMGRRSAGFEAAALVDSDVRKDGTILHRSEHLGGHQLRRCRAWNEHRANDQISLGDTFGDVGFVGEARLGPRFEMDSEPLEDLGFGRGW